jgi:hypothetical protein
MATSCTSGSRCNGPRAQQHRCEGVPCNGRRGGFGNTLAQWDRSTESLTGAHFQGPGTIGPALWTRGLTSMVNRISAVCRRGQRRRHSRCAHSNAAETVTEPRAQPLRMANVTSTTRHHAFKRCRVRGSQVDVKPEPARSTLHHLLKIEICRKRLRITELRGFGGSGDRTGNLLSLNRSTIRFNMHPFR